MKKITLLLIEIIIVTLLITLLVVLGIDKYNEFFNHFPRYTVKFKDVDGLSVGSPVRFAGVHIGHVVKQELKNNQIVVTFKVTDRDKKIPKNSLAGVEFTGLGGSKSLEIKPPETVLTDSNSFYKVEPVRVTSFMEIQNEIAWATLDFFNGVLSFLEQNEKNARANLRNATEMLKEKSASLEEIKIKIEEKGGQTVEDAEKLSNFVKETNQNIAQVNKAMNKITESKDLVESMNRIKDSTKNLSDFIESNKLQNFNSKVSEFNGKIIEIKDREMGYIEEFNQSLKTATENLQNFVDSFQKEDNNQESNNL